MFAQSRDEVRSHFINVWEKMISRSPLEPLEQILADVIDRHPQYHEVLKDPVNAMTAEFGSGPDNANPFLHMSLHVAIVEQLQTDRPPGVVTAYNAILAKRQLDPHLVEHKMIDCLSATLWQAKLDSNPPDESAYVACLLRSA